jgi:single-strand DNA-binding protein
MVSLNRVLLIGNLTRDPELRYTPSGTPVANLRLAVNSVFKDQSGQRKEETCYVTIVAWSKQAEVCQQYLRKGRPIFVEGRLIYRSWEAQGQTRSTMEVRADRIQFLGPPAGQAARAAAQEPAPEAPQPTEEFPAEGRDVEPASEAGADVPF